MKRFWEELKKLSSAKKWIKDLEEREGKEDYVGLRNDTWALQTDWEVQHG